MQRVTYSLHETLGLRELGSGLEAAEFGTGDGATVDSEQLA